MILYSGPMSLFTGKVRIALDEKGLDYELVSVPFSRAGYEPKHPKVLELNPKQQVPVLVDGDLAIYDSTIIFEYLEDRHPDARALSARPGAQGALPRAGSRGRRDPVPAGLGSHPRGLLQARRRAAATRRVVTAAQAAIAAHYDRLERQLGEQPFLCGDVSVADIGYFMTITFATSLGQGLTEAHPGLQSWYGRAARRARRSGASSSVS